MKTLDPVGGGMVSCYFGVMGRMRDRLTFFAQKHSQQNIIRIIHNSSSSFYSSHCYKRNGGKNGDDDDHDDKFSVEENS